jgi:tRNA-dihydrouridine synthase
MNTLRRLIDRLSVAPMMDWTKRHCRYLHRLFAPHALRYTEMIVAAAIMRGDAPPRAWRHTRAPKKVRPLFIEYHMQRRLAVRSAGAKMTTAVLEI